MATQELLYEMAKHFRADFEAGKLYWVDSRCGKKEAGTLKRKLNRVHVTYNGKIYLRYRILFALYHGYWPFGEIDHLDGCSSNDSISNLRDVPRAINARNCKVRSDNTSGRTGIQFVEKLGKWRARLGHRHLGVFENLSEAIVCRKNAAFENSYTERHGA